MLYLVSGSLHDRKLLSGPHEEFRELVQKTVAPSVELLSQFQAEGKILAGGVRASSPEVVFILDLAGESHIVVRHLLFQLPIFGYYHWEVTPLESFKDWTALVGG